MPLTPQQVLQMRTDLMAIKAKVNQMRKLLLDNGLMEARAYDNIKNVGYYANYAVGKLDELMDHDIDKLEEELSEKEALAREAKKQEEGK